MNAMQWEGLYNRLTFIFRSRLTDIVTHQLINTYCTCHYSTYTQKKMVILIILIITKWRITVAHKVSRKFYFAMVRKSLIMLNILCSFLPPSLFQHKQMIWLHVFYTVMYYCMNLHCLCMAGKSVLSFPFFVFWEQSVSWYNKRLHFRMKALR